MAEKIRVKTRTEERILRITYEEGSPSPLMYEDMGALVHCGECAEASVNEYGQLLCKRFASFNVVTGSEGFCAWGERRER